MRRLSAVAVSGIAPLRLRSRLIPGLRLSVPNVNGFLSRQHDTPAEEPRIWATVDMGALLLDRCFSAYLGFARAESTTDALTPADDAAQGVARSSSAEQIASRCSAAGSFANGSRIVLYMRRRSHDQAFSGAESVLGGWRIAVRSRRREYQADPGNRSADSHGSRFAITIVGRGERRDACFGNATFGWASSRAPRFRESLLPCKLDRS